MSHSPTDVRTLYAPEAALIDKIRRMAVDFGTVDFTVKAEFQHGAPVMVRVLRVVEEEKLR